MYFLFFCQFLFYFISSDDVQYELFLAITSQADVTAETRRARFGFSLTEFAYKIHPNVPVCHHTVG